MSKNLKIIIAPSILSADFGSFSSAAKLAEESGADWIHCDVMDGHFVPNLTFGPDTIAALRKAVSIPLDVHLMISKPDDYAQRFIDAGADHISVHVEAQHNVSQTIKFIRSSGKRVGVAINPDTPADKVYPFLDSIDELICMTVYPGFGGQSFISSVLDKIKDLRARASHLNIVVDGGVNCDTGRECVQAGANVLVAGNALFRHKRLNLLAAINELRQATEN